MLKVLQLCKKSPTPQKDGESIAIHQLSKSLVHSGAELDVIAMLTAKHPWWDLKGELPGVSYQYLHVDSEISVYKAIKSIFASTPYFVSRFYAKSIKKSITRALQKKEYDVVILEGIFLSPYLELIRANSKAKVILRAHNVEHRIWERYAKEERNFFKRIYIQLVLKNQLANYERRKVKEMDGVIAISPVDEVYFKDLGVENIMVLPIAVEKILTSALPTSFSLGFLGSLDWLPNLRGVEWFLKEVWLDFQAKYPNAKISLAGRNFPSNFFNLPYKNLFVLGEIDDSSSFIAKQSVMIVPLFSGSGMRVKIIEAMGNGKCVLTTTIGAEGISYENQKNIYLAETKKEWLSALSDLYTNEEKLLEIGKRAANLAKEKYSLESHSKNLTEFLS